ncbi:MAG TPA: flagellar biosynthetic protein FliQ [Coleofasciculaceae cyanobacterium]|jgi:type III secretory pathway component EscS
MELMMEHLGHGLILSLMLSMPCVIAAAMIGLVVGILQAVTQVQEQTIAAAPKILGVFAMILLGGGLMMTMLINYTRESVQIAFNEIPLDGDFILPPLARQASGQARARQFFKLQAKEGMNKERLQEFATKWGMQDDQNESPTVLHQTGQRSGTGNNALSVSEKMALDKTKGH